MCFTTEWLIVRSGVLRTLSRTTLLMDSMHGTHRHTDTHTLRTQTSSPSSSLFLALFSCIVFLHCRVCSARSCGLLKRHAAPCRDAVQAAGGPKPEACEAGIGARALDRDELRRARWMFGCAAQFQAARERGWYCGHQHQQADVLPQACRGSRRVDVQGFPGSVRPRPCGGQHVPERPAAERLVCGGVWQSRERHLQNVCGL